MILIHSIPAIRDSIRSHISVCNPFILIVKPSVAWHKSIPSLNQSKQDQCDACHVLLTHLRRKCNHRHRESTWSREAFDTDYIAVKEEEALRMPTGLIERLTVGVVRLRRDSPWSSFFF